MVRLSTSLAPSRRGSISRVVTWLATSSALAASAAVACDGTSTEHTHCTEIDRQAPAAAPAGSSTAAAAAATTSSSAVHGESLRVAVDGRAFPDGVLALTWDDGPDAHTLELAEYLAAHRVAATFFVVESWRADLSSDPGWGSGVYDTGYAALPVLRELVALGHRLGNHTRHHVLLTSVDAAHADDELLRNQRGIDPFVGNELRMFRAPGGAWNTGAARAFAADPALADVVGPVRWDVDRKDWEGSVSCTSARPTEECEHAGAHDGDRLKPHVVAARYLATIRQTRRGIVLLHDRVGDVGSRYALAVARVLVPELEARGFVFAAPVLAFSPMTPRLVAPVDVDAASLRFADLDGDGRADACARVGHGMQCFAAAERATAEGPRRAELRPLSCATTTAAAARPAATATATATASATAASAPLPFRRGAVLAGDVDGDGRADLCSRDVDGMLCSAASWSGCFEPAARWSSAHETTLGTVTDFSDAEGWASDASYADSVRLGDVDGDGKADACGRTPAGIVCARSTGVGFAPATLWLSSMSDTDGWLPARYGATLQLGDVNGDGRADACARGPAGIVCAVSTGRSFTHPARWSRGHDFADDDVVPWGRDVAYYGTIRLGDVNGDRRADACGRGPSGVVCALSNGCGFAPASTWSHDGMTDADGWRSPARAASLQLADVNGDGRADLCGASDRGVVCGLAP